MLHNNSAFKSGGYFFMYSIECIYLRVGIQFYSKTKQRQKQIFVEKHDYRIPSNSDSVQGLSLPFSDFFYTSWSVLLEYTNVFCNVIYCIWKWSNSFLTFAIICTKTEYSKLLINARVH